MSIDEFITDDQKQFLESVFANSSTGIVLYDSQFRYQYWNAFMEKLTGRSAAAVIGRVAFDLFPHLSEQGVDLLIREALKGRNTRSGDVFFQVPETAHTGWVAGEYSPYYDQHGKIVGVVGIIHDITRRKLIEREKEENAFFLQGVLGAVEDGICVLDPELNILHVNPAVKNMFPNQQPLCGKKCHTVFHRRAAICPWCPSVKTLQTGKMHSEVVPVPSPENPRQWFRISAFPLIDDAGLVTGVVEHAMEITEQKTARDLIESQHQFLLSVIESLPYPFYVIDAHTYEIVMGNSKILFDRQCHGQKCHSLTHHRNTPCDGKEHGCPLQIVKKTSQSVVLEHIHYDHDGREIFVEVHGSPVFDHQGKVVQMIEYAVDISQRKRLELEKEQLIADLTQALNDVRTLKGIVPICMYCKKIRDDTGYWNMLEKFITEQTEARLSHGICPQCYADRFGDKQKLAKWIKKKG